MGVLSRLDRQQVDAFLKEHDSEFSYLDFAKFIFPRRSWHDPFACIPDFYRTCLGYWKDGNEETSDLYKVAKENIETFKKDVSAGRKYIEALVESAQVEKYEKENNMNMMARRSAMTSVGLDIGNMPLRELSRKRPINGPLDCENCRKAEHEVGKQKQIAADERAEKIKYQHLYHKLVGMPLQALRLETMEIEYGKRERGVQSVEAAIRAGGNKEVVFASMKIDGCIRRIAYAYPINFATVRDYQQFENELLALKTLDGGKGIVQFHGTMWLSKKKRPAILLEKMDGNLHDLLKRPVLPDHVRLTVIYQMAVAIETMHLRHIVHRDVKLSNFLFKEGDRQIEVVISDFDSCSISSPGPWKTRCGTLEYAAPEMLGDTSYAFEVDVFSFGSAALQIATHCDVIREISGAARSVRASNYEESEVQRFFQLKRETLVRTASTSPSKNLANSTLDSILAAALDLNPGRRPSITAVKLQLQGMLDAMNKERTEARRYDDSEDGGDSAAHGEDDVTQHEEPISKTFGSP